MAKNKKRKRRDDALAEANIRHLLDPAKKREMLAILIRNQEAFETVRDMLTVDHVKDMGEGYGMVWRVVREFYDAKELLPPSGVLITQMHQAVKEAGSDFGDEHIEDVDGFLEYAYDDNEHGKEMPTSDLHRKVAVETCKQFMEELTAKSLRVAFTQDGTLPKDISVEIDKHMDQLNLVGSLTDVSIDVAFPDGWDTRERVKLFTTGCEAVDDFLGGGWCGGEVMLFMAPFGSCKTMLTCHAVAELIKHCAIDWLREYEIWEKKRHKKNPPPKPKRPMIVLMFTEGSKNDYRVRVLSHLATVPWKTLARMDSINTLSDSDSPAETPETQYEKDEFGNAEGDAFQNERVRIRNAVKQANQHLLLIDCTDSDNSPHKIGRGGIPELANIVRSYFRTHKKSYPMAFYLDHMSALADRICEATEGTTDDKLLRLTLKRLPRQCRDKLAQAWKAPMAVMHQLSGEANSRSTTAKIHHTDSSESKSVGEYPDFCIVAGTPSDEQLVVMRCTKHRREPPMSNKSVQLIGQFNRLVDRSTEYQPDPNTGGFIKVSDATAVNANKKVQKSLKALKTLKTDDNDGKNVNM